MLSLRLRHQLAHFALDVDIECRYPVTAIYGPSGAGKTTLLDMIAGLFRPDFGSIEIDDELVYSSTQL